MTDIAERLRHWSHGLTYDPAAGLMHEAAAEIEQLREAIRRLAEQDSTLSVQGGSVTVTLDSTLTDEEREAIEWCVEMATVHAMECDDELVTLRKLLERTK